MNVVEFVRTTAAKGKASELRQALEDAVRRFPKQPGCIGAKALQAIESEDPNIFFLIVEWESTDAHLKWRDSDTDGRIWFKENVRPLMDGTNLTGHFLLFAEA
jgi:heme-degrading monooxygenase HmoA